MSRKQFYKNCGMPLAELQKSRRKQLLEQHKQRRDEQYDELRGLLNASEETNYAYQPRKQQARFHDIFKHLGLQTAEWLREKPVDLDDWLLVPYPFGQRVLVVAHHAQTRVYNKQGRCFLNFHTLLPGDYKLESNITILDCVFDKNTTTYHVLDVLMYNNLSMIDAEADFRFYWLRVKFSENPQLSALSEKNQCIFQLLPHYDFTNKASIEEMLLQYPYWPDEQTQLQAFVFYHKHASYECKQITPLMCWLFPFMFEDVLGLIVNQLYAPPADYINARAFMDSFDAKTKAKKLYYGKHKKQKLVRNEVLDFMEVEPICDQEQGLDGNEEIVELDEQDQQKYLELQDSTETAALCG